jgi:hypothetical protein
MSWDKLSLTRLREIARHYNKEVKIAGIGKIKKEELIEELKKHLDYNHEKGEVKHKKEGKTYKVLDEDKKEEPKEKKRDELKELMDKTDAILKRAAEIKKAKTAREELAEIETKIKFKNRIKSQAEGAKADAMAIKGPDHRGPEHKMTAKESIAKHMEMVREKYKFGTRKVMTEAEARIELERLQKEAKEAKKNKK